MSRCLSDKSNDLNAAMNNASLAMIDLLQSRQQVSGRDTTHRVLQNHLLYGNVSSEAIVMICVNRADFLALLFYTMKPDAVAS